jgi:hypothetical protein
MVKPCHGVQTRLTSGPGRQGIQEYNIYESSTSDEVVIWHAEKVEGEINVSINQSTSENRKCLTK